MFAPSRTKVSKPQSNTLTTIPRPTKPLSEPTNRIPYAEPSLRIKETILPVTQTRNGRGTEEKTPKQVTPQYMKQLQERKGRRRLGGSNDNTFQEILQDADKATNTANKHSPSNQHKLSLYPAPNNTAGNKK
jgi:hypothetical protein